MGCDIDDLVDNGSSTGGGIARSGAAVDGVSIGRGVHRRSHWETLSFLEGGIILSNENLRLVLYRPESSTEK